MNALSRQLTKTKMFTATDRLEDELFACTDVIHPTEESPLRFEIMKESMKRGKGGPPAQMIPIMLPTLLGIQKSLKSLKDNPPAPKIQADAALFQEIEAYALKLGASSLGYTGVPARWVFQNKAIAFENAIVLSMEMDKKRIDTAPSIACETTVMEIYRDLGRIANKLAVFLRQRGYGAHAGHPLMGMALYPPLAQMAGLGWMGLNGLIITPEHGLRVRLAPVFTSIENLPLSEQNPHSWVADFCSSCKVCIKQCPANAIYDTPIDHGNGQITYVSNEKCFPYFSDYYGCSVCIAICPFNHAPYEKIKEKYKSRSI